MSRGTERGAPAEAIDGTSDGITGPLDAIDGTSDGIADPRNAIDGIDGTANRRHALSDHLAPSAGVDPTAHIDPTARIDPTAHVGPGTHIGPGACVGPGARIGAGVTLGPYAIVGAHSDLAADCHLEAHAVVGPHTTLGPRCRVASFAVVGAAPQDRRTPPDAPYRLVCGADNHFREGSTVSRGTAHGGGITRLGDGNLLMTHSHVGHDCQLGDGCTLANGVSLAGHVEVGDRVTFGGHAAVHQFCRVGRLALVAANAMVSRDVPPATIAAGDRATLRGLNVTGLRRAEVPAADRRALAAAYRAILRDGPRRAAAEALLASPVAEVRALAAFVLASPRGVARARAERARAERPEPASEQGFAHPDRKTTPESNGG